MYFVSYSERGGKSHTAVIGRGELDAYIADLEAMECSGITIEEDTYPDEQPLEVVFGEGEELEEQRRAG